MTTNTTGLDQIWQGQKPSFNRSWRKKSSYCGPDRGPNSPAAEFHYVKRKHLYPLCHVCTGYCFVDTTPIKGRCWVIVQSFVCVIEYLLMSSANSSVNLFFLVNFKGKMRSTKTELGYLSVLIHERLLFFKINVCNTIFVVDLVHLQHTTLLLQY